MNVATRSQIPLKLSHGMTIHKAQGMSLDKLTVDCSGAFAPGHIGVAVGRATCKAGLRIVNFGMACVIPQPKEVHDFYQALLAQAYQKDLQEISTCCQIKNTDFQSAKNIGHIGGSAGEYILDHNTEGKIFLKDKSERLIG